MKERAEIFWGHFLKIKDGLMDIDSLNEKDADCLLTELDGYLKEYSQGVDFILGDLTPQGRELNLTANGDEGFFQDVITLSENAPVMDFWQVTAFLPAEGKNQSIEYEGIKLRSADLFFVPMESECVKDKIGLQVGGKSLEKSDEVLSAAYLLCEKMIGEYNAATLIDYFDLIDLPEDYTQQGFLPLDYLPDFVEWKIEQIEKSL